MNPLCRHCGRYKVHRPRGLCWTCFYTPGIRKLYGTPDPAKAKYARRGLGGGDHYRPLPASPTSAAPGTPEKLAVLIDRSRRGEQLFHPLDIGGGLPRGLQFERPPLPRIA